MEVKSYLKDNFLIFDGAMGTMLQSKGLKAGEIPEIFNITEQDIILSVHESYIEAGAQVITANTFQANELKLKDTPYEVEEIISSGIKLAKKSGAKYTALDIGPLGQLMEPIGVITFERAYEIFRRQVLAGAAAGADIILIETISDLYEAKAAILAAKENSSLPVFCTMSFQGDGRTFTGTDPKTAALVLQGLGVDAMGINCSLGPRELIPIAEEMLRYAKIPIMLQPNAGLPRIEGDDTVYDIKPEEFRLYAEYMMDKGVKIIGGCCGTTPEYIKALSELVIGKMPIETKPYGVTAACSSTKTVIFDNNITAIGERINPTGKKSLKEALKEHKFDYVIGEAIDQSSSGADILDINVGLPEIDEVNTIKEVIKQVQAVVNVPLQIDSMNTKAVEEAVRIYNGRPIINSVNGKDSSLNSILPIVKKYGALVIGLTLDEAGIPHCAEERFKIAEKIVKRAWEHNIASEDILIDCLVLTASAQQGEVMETVKAIRMVKEKLRVKTVLGISNVSFGLPRREILNSTFLSAALGSGLDAAIINPSCQEIMDVVNSFRVLDNFDREARNFIKIYNQETAAKETAAKTDKDLKIIIMEGRREEAAIRAKELLEIKTPLQVINEYVIPALETVGEGFDKGKLFLPQLVQAAESAKAAFEIIKACNVQKAAKPFLKEKIILATVKGDIHDIGKNIAKMLLENYGFQVIDLGKDVAAKRIIDIMKKEEVRLIGLSALMTTTVKNMEGIIKSIREEKLPCAVMVGGAVLNEEYAQMVGADFYVKDAREGVKVANAFFSMIQKE